MNDIHGVNGKFAPNWKVRIVIGLKTGLRRMAIVCALGWLVYGAYNWGEFDKSRTLIAEAASIPMNGFELQGKTIEQLQDEFMGELAKKENAGGLPAYLDDNKSGTLSKKDKLSYGCLAYKLSTVERHYKAIHGEALSDLDAALLALDCEKAKALAKEAIFGKLNAIGEWMGATDKMAMKVQVIREMI